MTNSLAPDLTIAQVAECLQLSEQCIRTEILAGRIAAYRLPGGRRLRIRPETLEQIRSAGVAVKPVSRKE